MEKFWRLGTVTVYWYGHATVMLRAGKIIYFDPYNLPAGVPRADYVFISHDHFDHCDPGSVKKIAKTGTVVVTTSASAAKLSGVEGIDVIGVKEGEKKEFDGVNVCAVPAYNVSAPYHPRGVGVGFVVDFEGLRFYFAGDTDKIPEMDGLKDINLAFLPIGGTYTMDVDEAAHACASFLPKIVVLVHYNTVSGTEADPKEFVAKIRELAQGVKVLL